MLEVNIAAELIGVSVINSFSGTWKWLSNFYPCSVWADGIEYASVEHAYQALKTVDPGARAAIQRARKPGTAKALGRTVLKREGWDAMKVQVMTDLCRQKFRGRLGSMLAETDGVHLMEGNEWNDYFWGCVWQVGATPSAFYARGVYDFVLPPGTRSAGMQHMEPGWWKGQNQLGRILMNVRKLVINHKEN